jgi:hypothetical protein
MIFELYFRYRVNVDAKYVTTPQLALYLRNGKSGFF